MEYYCAELMFSGPVARQLFDKTGMQKICGHLKQ
jgi:hypothetical protein